MLAAVDLSSCPLMLIFFCVLCYYIIFVVSLKEWEGGSDFSGNRNYKPLNQQMCQVIYVETFC